MDDKRIERQKQANYRRKVARLQNAGLLGKVNLRLKRDPKARAAIIKYRDFLSGRVAAVKAPSDKIAKQVRKSTGLRGKGKVVLVKKEGKETRLKITKDAEIISRRRNPATGEMMTVKKGKGVARPPGPGETVYYTIRERRRGLGTIKRTTFNKFDDLLEYLNAYDLNFEDVEEYFETETLSDYGRKAEGYEKTITKERRAGHERWRRRMAREKKKSGKPKRGRGRGGGKRR